jgi:amino acid transporter
MASYVLYGFDTAGTLAEETGQPRRRAPWAILSALAAAALAGALLILFGILAVSDPSRPELGAITGGLPFLVKDVLGIGLGTVFLADVVFAVFVCALAVHAGTVRLVFAMARDNNLPLAHALAHVPERTRTPLLPVVLIGGLAAALLIVNIDLPHVIETLCSVAIVWVNLAYLLVTFPMLIARLRRRSRAARPRGDADDVAAEVRLFSMGRLGLPVNAVAVVWGLFVIVNISWPRPEIYGSDPWGRFAAPLSTLSLVALGAVYYRLVQRRRRGILAEHASSLDRSQWSVSSEDREERSVLGLF